MTAFSHIIKNARADVHAGPVAYAEAESPHDAAEPDGSTYLGGVIRDGRTRMQAQPYTVDGPDWAADLPLPASAADQSPEPETESVDHSALRAEWKAEWNERATAEREAAVAAAREEAYAKGRADARAEFEIERDAERAASADDAVRLRTLWEDHLTAADPLLVGLAVDVAEAVLDGALGDEAHAATVAAMTRAIEQLAANPPLVVTLHPVDHLRLQEAGMVDALTTSHPGLRWVPDPTLAEGDWSLDAAGAAIRRVRSEVLHDLRVRLGLAASDASADDPAT